MTATGGGRDDLPATGESLPSHSPSPGRAGRLRAAGPAEATGRAADEAAARRKLRACPLADAKAAGFESAHGFQAAFGHVGNREGRTPDLRVQDLSGRKAGLRSARRHRWNPGLRLEDPPGRTGLRPGGCETGGPRASAHGPSGGTEASAEDLAITGTGASALGPRWGEEGREFRTAERRTARASALVGEPAGKPALASAGKGPRRKRRFEPPVQIAAHSKPPRAGRLASQARFRQRDSGGRRRRRPPLLSGPCGSATACGVFIPGQSSRCRPASRHRA